VLGVEADLAGQALRHLVSSVDLDSTCRPTSAERCATAL
jgi:hypothetical protein